MTSKEGRFIMELVNDFVDNIIVYRSDLQDEIATLIYILIKKKQDKRKKTESILKGGES